MQKCWCRVGWVVLVCIVFSSGCVVRNDSQPAAAESNVVKTKSGDSEASGTATAVTEITTTLGPPMLVLPAGQFAMGNAQGAPDEQPVHDVEVGSFAIDKFEVTQDLLTKLEIPNPSHFKGDRRPAEQIRWTDAVLICNARSRAEGLEPCYDEATFACNFEASGYRLPTEAEWEYAARAGTTESEPLGTPLPRLDQQACYAANSGKQTDLVGRRKPNAWGLHDMRGNVVEWCQDVYQAD